MTVCNTTEGQSCWISVMEQGITCKTQDACDHCKHMYCTLVLSFSPNKKNAYLDNWLKVNVKKYTVQRNQLSVNSYSASLACAFGVRYIHVRFLLLPCSSNEPVAGSCYTDIVSLTPGDKCQCKMKRM